MKQNIIENAMLAVLNCFEDVETIEEMQALGINSVTSLNHYLTKHHDEDGCFEDDMFSLREILTSVSIVDYLEMPENVCIDVDADTNSELWINVKAIAKGLAIQLGYLTYKPKEFKYWMDVIKVIIETRNYAHKLVKYYNGLTLDLNLKNEPVANVVDVINVNDAKETIKALEEFKQAYYNLLVSWCKNDVINATEAVHKYPFKKSFNELEVLTWVDETVAEIKAKSEIASFNYQMLSRLKSDCEYYLGNGNRSQKHLYYEDQQEHINKMKELFNNFPDDKKPEWLTYEQFLAYEKAMVIVPAR